MSHLEGYDPTPHCGNCGSMTDAGCTCPRCPRCKSTICRCAAYSENEGPALVTRVLVHESTYIELLAEDFEFGETLQEVAAHKIAKLRRENKTLGTVATGVEMVRERGAA